MDVLVTSMRPSGPGGSARKDRPGNGGQLREPPERVVVAGAIKTNTTAAANRGIHSSVAVVHASHRSSVILPSRPPALSSSRSVGGVVRASAGVDFQTPVKGRNTTDGNHEERGTATPTTAVTPITASSSSARGVTSLPLPNCSLPALSPSSLNVRMVPHINRLPPTDPLHSYTAVEDDDVPRGDHTCSSSSSSDLDDVDYGSSPHCHGGGVASFFENEPVMVVVGAQDVLRPNTLRRSSAADVHEDDDDVGDDVGRHPRPAAGSAVMRLRNYAFPTSPSTTSPTPRDEEQDAPVTRPEEEAVPNSRYPVEIQMSPPPLTSFGKPTEMAPPKRRNVPLPFEESQSLPKASTAPPSPQHHKYLQHQQQQPTSPPAGEDGDGKRVSENDDLHLTAAMMAQLLVPAAESRKPSDTLPPGSSTVVETESTTRRGTEAVRPRTSAAYFLEQRLGQNRQSRGVLSRDSGLAALHAPFSHEIKSLDAGDLTAPSTREQRTFSEIVTDVIKKKVSSVKSFRRRLTSVNTTGSVVGMAQKQSSSAFVDDVPGSPLAREPFGGGFGDSMKTSVRRASVNDDAAGSPLAAFRGKRNRRPSMATLRAMEYEPTKEEAGDELDDDDPLEIMSDDDWEGVTGEDVASGPTKSSPHESLTTAVHAGDPATARNDENGTRTVTFLAERRAGGIKGGGADDPPLMQLIKDPLPAPLQTPASGSPALSVASQDAGFSGGDFGISPRNTNGRHTPRASLAGAAQPHLLRVDLVCSRTLDTAVDQTALELLHHNMRVLDICENPREMRQLSLWRHILVCGGSSLRCIGVVCMLFVVVVCVVLFPILHANGRL